MDGLEKSKAARQTSCYNVELYVLIEEPLSQYICDFWAADGKSGRASSF